MLVAKHNRLVHAANKRHFMRLSISTRAANSKLVVFWRYAAAVKSFRSSDTARVRVGACARRRWGVCYNLKFLSSVPIVQRPRTWPFQGQNTGSNPVGDVTNGDKPTTPAISVPIASFPSNL
jgi:hypothetical protein